MCCCPSAGGEPELWTLINLRNRKQKSSHRRRAAGCWLETSRWAAEFSITPQCPETNVYRPNSDTETGWGVFTDSWFHVSAQFCFSGCSFHTKSKSVFSGASSVRPGPTCLKHVAAPTLWLRTTAPLLYQVLPNVLFDQAAEQMSLAHLKDTTSLQNYRCLSKIKHVVT